MFSDNFTKFHLVVKCRCVKLVGNWSDCRNSTRGW